MNRTYRSKNFDDRSGQPIDTLVLHYTDMESSTDAAKLLCDPDSQVSAHYLVSEKGEVFALVDEEKRAWHAGVSHWRGNANINARSIGIEVANPGHSHGYPAFPEAQMKAATELCSDIVKRHDIPARNVVAHSDIAFLRKDDPGEKFDWRRLAKAGVGVFPFDARSMPGEELKLGDTGTSVMKLQTSLSNWGYGLKLDGRFGEKTEKCVIAFQRHFRPDNLNGVWDNECSGLLAALHGLV